MPTALVLEDDAERLERFRAVAARLGVELVCWRDAHRMIAELGELLPTAAFVSLDHDLEPEDATDPGDGLAVAKHLSRAPAGVPGHRPHQQPRPRRHDGRRVRTGRLGVLPGAADRGRLDRSRLALAGTATVAAVEVIRRPP